MKRTQLYLDEEIWEALHIRSRQSGTSISELVRQVVRDRYASRPTSRRKAMQSLVGMWKDRSRLPEAETYVRQLRRGRRLKRIVR